MQLMVFFNAASPDFFNKTCLFLCENCLGSGGYTRMHHEHGKELARHLMQFMAVCNAAGVQFENKMCLSQCEKCLGPDGWCTHAP
jgi:hypothetical protein